MRSNYLYATGRIRSLETKLLSQNDLERMADAKDVNAAFKIFGDLGYTEDLSDAKNNVNYAEALKKDLLEVKRLFDQIIPDKKIIKILFSIYDFHNIKLFFKAKYLSKEFTGNESLLGNIDIDGLKDAIIKDVKASIPEKFALIIKEAKKYFEKESNGFIIDSYLDSKYLEMIKTDVRAIKNNFIKILIKLWIDVANVKIFLRAKKLNLEIDKFSIYLADGGNILKSSLVNSFNKDFKEAISVCLRGFEDRDVKDAIKEYSDGGELWKLEKAFENYEIKFLEQAKYIAYGPEVAVAYYLAKRNAAKNIRLVFTGKLNNISGQEIKERIRFLY